MKYILISEEFECRWREGYEYHQAGVLRYEESDPTLVVRFMEAVENHFDQKILKFSFHDKDAKFEDCFEGKEVFIDVQLEDLAYYPVRIEQTFIY